MTGSASCAISEPVLLSVDTVKSDMRQQLCTAAAAGLRMSVDRSP